MKKKIVFLASIAVFVIGISAFPVSAASFNNFNDADSASVDIVFTLTENDVRPPDSSPSGEPESTEYTYTVIIPASINLTEQQEFVIRAEDVSISDNKRVVVSLDGARTFADDGEFYLYNGGTDLSRRVRCLVRRGPGDSGVDESELVVGPNDTPVAEFKDSDVVSRTYGRLFVFPTYDFNNLPGTYTGTMYFKIGIEDD